MSNKKDRSALTLNQAILAPIEAVLQAQVHSARSFLNLILQMGFDHKPLDEKGKEQVEKDDSGIYRLSFVDTQIDSEGNNKKYRVSIPTISALPLNPLAIKETEIEFKMDLENSYEPQNQLSKSRSKETEGKEGEFDKTYRPWQLVEDPVQFKGTISPNNANSGTSQISVKIKMGETQVPDSLRKFISSVSDFSKAELLPDEQGE